MYNWRGSILISPGEFRAFFCNLGPGPAARCVREESASFFPDPSAFADWLAGWGVPITLNFGRCMQISSILITRFGSFSFFVWGILSDMERIVSAV